MTIFIANFTDNNIDEAAIRDYTARHLAKYPTHRILKISVVFLPPKRMQRLNQEYRNKDYIPDVLTFPDPLNEILICPEQAKKNGNTITYLIEHGVNHLMGTHHGEA